MSAVKRVGGWRTLPYRLLRWFPLPMRLHWLAAQAVNQRFLLGVLGLIRNDTGEVLLFHHTYKRQPWGLPGGWMERGELPQEALEREVREESTLQVRSQRLLMVGVVRDRPKLEFFVQGELLDGSFRPSAEVDTCRWWPADALPPMGRMNALVERALRVPPGQVETYEMAWIEERWGK